MEINTKKKQDIVRTPIDQYHQRQQKTTKKVTKVSEPTTKYMEIGDLDLEGLEVACFDKIPTQIPPQQVSLLEKAIIHAENMKSLGVVVESLKESNGKMKIKKENRGRQSNVQRIKVVGAQLVASGQHPTIDATLSPSS